MTNVCIPQALLLSLNISNCSVHVDNDCNKCGQTPRFGLKYRHVVTLKRVGTFVLYFWIAFNFDDGSKILRYLKIYGYAFSELVTPGLLLLENCVRSSTSSSFITKCPSRTRMRRNSTEHLRIVFCWLKLMLSPGQYSFCYSYNQQVLHLYPCTGYLQQLLFV